MKHFRDLTIIVLGSFATGYGIGDSLIQSFELAIPVGIIFSMITTVAWFQIEKETDK